MRFPSQVYEHTEPTTLFLSLNTSLPPFNNQDVRQALNFAVDRRQVVDYYGGPAVAALTCQFLPPNFPGHEPYCPYTSDPRPGGQWTGPDFGKAQDLVRRSGTAGTHVTFWYSPAFSKPPCRYCVRAKAAAEYFVRLLEKLDFPTDLRSTGNTFDKHFLAIYDSGRRIQIAPSAWIADYPAATNFITPQLTCHSFHPNDPFQNMNSAAFCDREIDKMIDNVGQIQTEDPAASGEAWAEVDRALTDRAPFVSLVNPIGVAFVSERLANYQYNPE